MIGKIIRRVRYLWRHESVRSNPIRFFWRAGLWKIYRTLRISPVFRLTPNGGPRIKIESSGHIGAASAFVFRDGAEPELSHLDLFLRPGNVFVDAGANIGVFSLKAAHIVGPMGRVLAFEPGSDSANRLELNVVLNGYDHLTVIRKALSDKVGAATLHHAGEGPVTYSLIAGTTATSGEPVEVTTLDRELERLGITRLDCLKIDVEGAEPNVIQGALQSISHFRPKIVYEINSSGTQRSDRPADEVWKLLAGIDYRFFLLERGKLKSVDTFPAITRNLIAVPVESRLATQHSP